MHRSPYFGQSVEFLQHREYTPGDDLRHIDWKVWAKQDRYYVKQYEEDTNLRATLLVDVSGSMQYGRGPLNKYEYACTIGGQPGVLAVAAARRGRLRGVRRSGSRATVPHAHQAQPSELDHPVALRERAAARRPTCSKFSAARPRRYPRRGMMILISDLLVDRAGLFKGLKLLRQRGHDVLVFHVMDDDELDFPFTGPTRFEGLELPQHVSCNPRALREGYLEALNAYLEEIRRACSQNEVDYRLVRTSEPLDAVLAHFISNRMGMMRRAYRIAADRKSVRTPRAVHLRQYEMLIAEYAIVPLSTADRHCRRIDRVADLNPSDQFDATSANPVGGDGVSARQPAAQQHMGVAQATALAALADRGHRRGNHDGHAAVGAKQMGALFGSGKLHHIVLLDDSFSMSDHWADTSAFDEAKQVILPIGQAMGRAALAAGMYALAVFAGHEAIARHAVRFDQ